MANDKLLGELEQMMLLAVLRVGDEAYGRSIRMELATQTGRQVVPGAAYVTLERLESKGFLSSRAGSPTPGRGGRPKRYFTVTPSGLEVLLQTRRAFANLWKGLEHLAGT